MSDTLAHSKNAKQTPSIQEKPKGLSDTDLALVAERLALIRGHLGKMPQSVISGARVMNGFLLVAAVRCHDTSLLLKTPGGDARMIAVRIRGSGGTDQHQIRAQPLHQVELAFRAVEGANPPAAAKTFEPSATLRKAPR